MKVKIRIIAPVIALLLVACGGPSDSEVEKAVRSLLTKEAESQKQLAALFGRPDSAEIEKRLAAVKIVVGDKNKQNDGSYVSVVTIKSDADSKTMQLHLIKGSDGWVVSGK
jgi:hypothetical protein